MVLWYFVCFILGHRDFARQTPDEGKALSKSLRSRKEKRQSFMSGKELYATPLSLLVGQSSYKSKVSIFSSVHRSTIAEQLILDIIQNDVGLCEK